MDGCASGVGEIGTIRLNPLARDFTGHGVRPGRIIEPVTDGPSYDSQILVIRIETPATQAVYGEATAPVTFEATDVLGMVNAPPADHGEPIADCSGPPR